MREPHRATEDHHEPAQYKIRIKGHLDHRWADQFESMSFIHESDGTTTFAGSVVDQAALHGLLRKVRDLGMHLISVIQVEIKQANEPDDTMDHYSKKETHS